MRITREMKTKDFEGHALDMLARMSDSERKRLANFLRLYGLSAGSDAKPILSLAKTVERF